VVGSTQVKGQKGRDVQQARCGPLVPDPEAADRLEPKGMWSGAEAQRSSAAAVAPPAQRQDLTRSVTSVQRGKPVVLPLGESAPQGAPLGLRVKDEGVA
jgi:hypothetical protein